MVPRKYMPLIESRMQQQRLSPMADVDGGFAHQRGSSRDINSHGDNGFILEDSYDEEQQCFHEVHAIPLLDPVLDKQV